MSLALFIAAAFLLGSVPAGLVLARLKGIDIRKTGSGNIGATNVLRSVGKKEALITLIFDFAKGAVPVAIAGRIFPGSLSVGLVGFSAIAGHVFSIFLKFRGGKGVATSLGVLSVYSPLTAAVTVALWLGVFAVSRYSSLGAIVSFLLLPLTTFAADNSREKILISFLISLLIIVRHKDNIKRLVKGEESRVRTKT
jgi:glycerol-3-phosphate acyltransferase PlsY